MSDNSNGQQGADPNAQGGQAQGAAQQVQNPSGTVQTPQQAPQQAQTPQNGPTFTLDYVKGLRDENADWRIKFSKAEQDKVAAETRIATLEQDLKKMQANLEETALNEQIRAVAGELRLIDDVDGIKRFLETSKLKKGQDGKFENLKAELEELVKTRPYLVNNAAGASPAPGQTQKATPPTNPPRTGQIKLSHEAINAMSTKEIEENWVAIQAFLAGNN